MTKVAVLLGGISPERYISYRSGWAVASALESLGYKVYRFDPAFGKDSLIDQLPPLPDEAPTPQQLAAFDPRNYIACITDSDLSSCELVVNMLHGPYGEDGVVQTLLELCGIPYTGSNALACRLAMDKARAKLLFAASGIPTPAWVTIEQGTALTNELLDELREQFRMGMVVKPNSGGSTIGISIVTSGNFDDIEEAIRCAWSYDHTALVEAYIPGRELTVAVLNNQALPIVEIIPQGGFYDYAHKYRAGMSEYIVPAPLDEMVAEFIGMLAVSAHRALGCRGITRVDFRLDEDNQPWCLEVNTIPGMTETSLVPKAAQAAGISFVELCQRLIEVH
ncbi:MAG: D-alanine--D-alanine ligase [Bacteroidota bacterium]|nr:D-alanine--D-alanine ligase [Candidatus Kapabacteria bacterium]MDW8074412.1 D-alanine--D-alanine ligase [Bacteroidota bacterium]